MKTIIEAENIDTLRGIMRTVGCVYRGLSGWFSPNGRPVGIYFGNNVWYTVIES